MSAYGLVFEHFPFRLLALDRLRTPMPLGSSEVVQVVLVIVVQSTSIIPHHWGLTNAVG